MQITAVKLENAKSYDNALIEFAPGVNAIVGHNGAGKSTILEAIGLAVFDQISYTQSEFVRAGTRTATVTVTLESNLDGRIYDVVRRVGGVNTHYILDPETGIKQCEGKADVLSFLHEHMGVDNTTDLSALFRDAVGVGQGTFTAAFLATPGGRKSVFDRLLQVEDYNKADTKLRDPARELGERQHGLEVTIADLRARLEALPELERAVAARDSELKSAKQAAERSRAELTDVVAARKQLEDARSKLSEMRTEHGRALERQQAAARELATATQARADAEGARRLVAEHTPGYERYLAAQERQKELDVKVRERQRLERQRADNERNEAVAEARMSRLQEELSLVDASAVKMERLKEAVAQQTDLDAQIAQAQQAAARLTELEEQIGRGQAQLAQLSTRTEQLNAAAERRKAAEERSSSLQHEEDEARRTVDTLRGKLARMKSEADTIAEQTEALQNANTSVCPVCEKPLAGEHREGMLQRNEERLEKLRTQYRDVQAQAKSIEAESAARRALLQQVEREIRDLPSAGELERLTSDMATAQSALAGLETQHERFSTAADRIESLQAQLSELGDPRSAFVVAQNQAAREATVKAEFENTATELKAVQAELSANDLELRQFNDLDAQLDACDSEIHANEESYRVVLSNTRLAGTYTERAADVERLTASVAALSEEIKALSDRLTEASRRFDEDAYTRILSQEQALNAKEGALDARIEMMHRQQADDRAAIADLLQKQAKLKTSESSMAVIGQQTEVLQTIRTLLRQAGPYVTRVLIRQVSDNARQIFSDIMQDYTRHLTWNEDYGIVLEVDGHERDFSQLSGGEQMTAALSVRLALLRELSNIDIAFFDEPTANLDEARRESLARQILNVKGFRQLFVISHDDTFEQATQNLIRVERINGVSTVASS